MISNNFVTAVPGKEMTIVSNSIECSIAFPLACVCT